MFQLSYGFDNYLYCKCGAGKVVNYSFHCNADSHGNGYAYYPKGIIQDLLNNLKSFNGLTILILGETGVGKSTFINGFANYLQYSNRVSQSIHRGGPCWYTVVVIAENSCAEGLRFNSLTRQSPRIHGQRTIKNKPGMTRKGV